MKLATRRNGTRDGELIVVSRDLSRFIPATQVAATLQVAIDNWANCAPRLTDIYQLLNENITNNSCNSSVENFETIQPMAPLPRAFQWADGSAYVNHIQLVRRSRGAEMPHSYWTDPLMYQGGSDTFLGAKDDIKVADETWGIDFEAEISVIIDDVPSGIQSTEASSHIILLMLVNDVSLRNLIPAELAKGFGFFHSKPSTSFSPVAISPDELGSRWFNTTVDLPLLTHFNGKLFGRPNAATDMTFNFATLISHAAKTRNLCAGTIIGSGTVSNQDRSVGSSCLVEKRMLELIEHAEATTQFMKFGDRVRIEMMDENGCSLFGAIDQEVKQA